MSADNGIYIAKFPDGFRVAYAQCIENIDYYRRGSKARKVELGAYFGGSPLFSTKELASAYAFEMYERMKKDEEENGMFGCFILEYGISYIGEYESFL